METLERDDIQGLVVRGYGELPAAQFLLLRVADVDRARAYLQRIAEPALSCDDEPIVRVTRASEKPSEVAMHVAFTHGGLAKLGVPATSLRTFARELVEGMDQEVRSVALGDQGPNDPSTWTWGRDKPDALLMLYASEAAIEAVVAREREAFAGAFEVMATKPSSMLPDQKEHFGWKDGISTPIIEGVGGKPIAGWTYPIRAGEFVLGYKNEYEAYTESPTVELSDDTDDLLPFTFDRAAKDIGCNGTYLVYREMTQHVRKFWGYLARESREPGADPAARAIALGAKMVGRWPGGAPLVVTPRADLPALANDNDFTFYDTDRGGQLCPLGSHIRRTNPRDHLPSDRDRSDSVEMVRKHQMLRRGRPFGAPLVDSMDPRDFMASGGAPEHDEDAERGLHFICLVGHIGRQFEFVQRAWINSPNFAAQFKDSDPIIGVHHAAAPNPSDEFTCPASPVRRKYKGMPQFTRLVGGAYFFMPGLRALRYIARGSG